MNELSPPEPSDWRLAILIDALHDVFAQGGLIKYGIAWVVQHFVLPAKFTRHEFDEKGGESSSTAL